MFVEVLRLRHEERRGNYYKRNSLLNVRAAFDRWSEIVTLPEKKISSARYFYNHLSNYTKTIIRLRLVNIGEYSLRLPRIIVNYSHIINIHVIFPLTNEI